MGKKKTAKRRPVKKKKASRRPKVAKRIYITVEFTNLRGEHGEATKIDDRNYLVKIHTADNPFTKYLTFIHEVAGHVGSWIFTPFIDDKREHRFITALEKSAKRHWRKYWEGK
jgi:hypothetical protein